MRLSRVFGTAATPIPISERDVERAIVETIAATLQVSPDEIDVHRGFADYGLDSMQLVSLSGDLERLLDRRIPETVAWDYPTIHLLARYLVDPASCPAAAPPDFDDAEIEYEM